MILSPKPAAWGLFVAVSCVAAAQAGTNHGLAPRERARAAYGDLAPEILAGEVVLKSDVTRVVLAIDVAGPDGRGDGRVDHVFYYHTVQPIFTPISLWDPSAEIEVRPTGLRLLAHTREREVEMLISGISPTPRPKVQAYSLQVLELGVQLFRYSGKVVEDLSLADVEEKGADVMRPFHTGKLEKLFPQHPSPPDPDPGGSCRSSCSSSGCNTGACSAACTPGHCAKCQCVGDPPSTVPLCYCT